MTDFAEEILQLEDENEVENKYLTFRIDGQLFGMSIACVNHISDIPEAVPVPESPSYLSGLINLRGQVLPLINGRKRIRGTDEPYDGRAGLIVVENGESSFALQVDRVENIVTLTDDQIEPVAKLDIPSPPPYLYGVHRTETSLITILTPRCLATDAAVKAAVMEAAELGVLPESPEPADDSAE